LNDKNYFCFFSFQIFTIFVAFNHCEYQIALLNRIVYIVICFVSSFCCSSGLLRATTPDNDGTYRTEKRLFHIERSKNKNIVCYDLHANATDAPDEKKPLSVYWINREERPGQYGKLSYIQEKLAYGYTVKGKQNGKIVIELNAAKNRKITLEHNGQEYFCLIDINRQPSVLQMIYIKTKTGNSLQVEYVDIQGLDLATGAPVTERFTP